MKSHAVESRSVRLQADREKSGLSRTTYYGETKPALAVDITGSATRLRRQNRFPIEVANASFTLDGFNTMLKIGGQIDF